MHCCSSCLQQSHMVTFLWTALGFVFFTVTWGCTDGGYYSSIPLFFFFTAYCYGANLFKGTFCGIFISNIKINIAQMFREEKSVVTLMLSYSFLKTLLQVIYPGLENSNGSPYHWYCLLCSSMLFLYYLQSFKQLFVLKDTRATVVTRNLQIPSERICQHLYLY